MINKYILKIYMLYYVNVVKFYNYSGGKIKLYRVLKKIIGFILVFVFIITNTFCSLSFADDESQWQKGFTGSNKDEAYNFDIKTEKNVIIENNIENIGKFSAEEDSIAYYGKMINSNSDFEITANVTIDSYNIGKEITDINETSFGIGIIDEIYNTENEKYVNSVFLGINPIEKDDKSAFFPIIRTNSEKKAYNKLSDNISNKGQNLGIYKLNIKKSGTSYLFNCNGATQQINYDSFTDSVYPCVYVAGNAKITFQDIDIKINSREAIEIKITQNPKIEYYYGEDIDLTDLKGEVYYSDGTIENLINYTVDGYNKDRVGKQTITISKNGANAYFDVMVNKIQCTDIIIDYEPVKTEYFVNSNFKIEGLKVSAVFSNGSRKQLNDNEYTMRLGKIELNNNTKLTQSLSSNDTVKVFFNDTEGASRGTVVGSFNIKIKNNEMTGLTVKSEPVKKIYGFGESIDLKGLQVMANYKDDNGQIVSELLKSDDYSISGFETRSIGDKNVVVTFNNDKTKTTSFIVKVQEREPVKLELTTYPRTTYSIGESFDETGMVVSNIFDNGEKSPTNNYTIDKSSFDSSKIGTTYIKIIPKNNLLKEIKVDISISDIKQNKWRRAILGEYSQDEEIKGNSGVRCESYGKTDGLINIRAWENTGKINNSGDGIVYYYTHLNTDKNFSLSADIKVNRYLENNNDANRTGEEAFGILVADVIPLKGKNNEKTYLISNAQLDEENEPLPFEGNTSFLSNIVIAGGYSGIKYPDNELSADYERNKNINRINLFVRKGINPVQTNIENVEPENLSSHFPVEGDTYNITLSKINGGLFAKCYDYSSKRTIYKYLAEDNILNVQDNNNIYVGFFASQWADIDITNVKFYQSEPKTDQTIVLDNKNEIIPDIKVYAEKLAQSSKYQLILEPVNSSGTVTIKQNSQIIEENYSVKEGINKIGIVIERDIENKFTVVYTPDYNNNLSSYDDIITQLIVDSRV